TTWLAKSPDAAALYAGHPEVLDCVDDQPADGDLIPPDLKAFDIHPLAKLRCGVQYRPPVDPTMQRPPFQILDVTCGGHPQTCIGADGAGDPEQTDCDDHDPRRFHGNPRPRNCCQCGDKDSCATNHAKVSDLSPCQPPRCGTTFDFDCTGRQVDC